MSGTCLEAAHQDRKNHGREEQDLREETEGRKAAALFLSLKMEQLQKQLQEEKKEKVGRKGQDGAYVGSQVFSNCTDQKNHCIPSRTGWKHMR